MTRSLPIAPRPSAPRREPIALGTHVKILAPRTASWKQLPESDRHTGRIGTVIAAFDLWAKVRFENGEECAFSLVPDFGCEGRMNMHPKDCICAECEDSSALAELHRILAMHCAAINKLLSPGTKVTLIARLPGKTDHDVFVSNDPDTKEIIEVVRRSELRETFLLAEHKAKNEHLAWKA